MFPLLEADTDVRVGSASYNDNFCHWVWVGLPKAQICYFQSFPVWVGFSLGLVGALADCGGEELAVVVHHPHVPKQLLLVLGLW